MDDLTPEQERTHIDHNSSEFGEFCFYIEDIKKPLWFGPLLGGKVGIYLAAIHTGTPLRGCAPIIFTLSEQVEGLDFFSYVVYETGAGFKTTESPVTLNYLVNETLKFLNEMYVRESVRDWSERKHDGNLRLSS